MANNLMDLIFLLCLTSLHGNAPSLYNMDTCKPNNTALAELAYFLIRAFMSLSHGVRAFSCPPPSCSALPLLAAGTKIKMSVPVIMPRSGETWKRKGREKPTISLIWYTPSLINWGKHCFLSCPLPPFSFK